MSAHVFVLLLDYSLISHCQTIYIYPIDKPIEIVRLSIVESTIYRIKKSNFTKKKLSFFTLHSNSHLLVGEACNANNLQVHVHYVSRRYHGTNQYRR